MLAELDASSAVIGDVQFLPGYSLALRNMPGVDRLSDLPRANASVVSHQLDAATDSAGQ